jgi:hypothetical protein
VQKLEVVNKILYLGVKKEIKGGWRSQKARIKATGNQTVGGIHKYLTKTPNFKVDMLENMHEMIRDSRLYGEEIWGVYGGWDIVDGVQSRIILPKYNRRMNIGYTQFLVLCEREREQSMFLHSP